MEKGKVIQHDYLRVPLQLLDGVLLGDGETKVNFLLNAYSTYYVWVARKMGMDRLGGFERFCERNGVKELEGKLSHRQMSSIGNDILNNIGTDNFTATYINIEIFEDFYNEAKSLKVWEAFIMALALKSIIGTKPIGVDKTNYRHVWARMNGRKKAYQGEPDHVKSGYKKRKLKQIKDVLVKDWYLTYYAENTRGFYFSFTKNYEFVKKYAEAQKQKNSNDLEKEVDNIPF